MANSSFEIQQRAGEAAFTIYTLDLSGLLADARKKMSDHHGFLVSISQNIGDDVDINFPFTSRNFEWNGAAKPKTTVKPGRKNGGCTFEKYLKSKGVELHPWQREAADAFLAVVHKDRSKRGGKTFLMEQLTAFINEYGNVFDI